MGKMNYEPNIENKDRAIQPIKATSPAAHPGAVSHVEAHEFRWIETRSGGIALCSCGRWELRHKRPRGLTQEAAKRDYALHLGMVADRAVGHDGALQDEATREASQVPV